MELVEVELGLLLDELGAGLVGFGVSLGEWELVVGFCAVGSGFLLEGIVWRAVS